MPYKDPDRQREAQRELYRHNKDRIYERQQQRRAQPGYRDSEYAKRLGLTVEEYARWKASTSERRSEAARRAAETRASRSARARAIARRPHRVTPEEQALIDKQRQMKADALAWLEKKRAEKGAT